MRIGEDPVALELEKKSRVPDPGRGEFVVGSLLELCQGLRLERKAHRVHRHAPVFAHPAEEVAQTVLRVFVVVAVLAGRVAWRTDRVGHAISLFHRLVRRQTGGHLVGARGDRRAEGRCDEECPSAGQGGACGELRSVRRHGPTGPTGLTAGVAKTLHRSGYVDESAARIATSASLS